MRLFLYWWLGRVVLIVAGVWWCVEVFRSFREDFRSIRRSKDADLRWAVIGYWLLTLFVVAVVASLIPGVARDLWRGMQTFL